MKIKLILDTSIENLTESLQDFEFIRLKCLVGFKSIDGYSYRFTEALVDTGAYISVIPSGLAKKIEKEILGEDKLKGINRRDECSIPVLVGKTSCILFDKDYNVTEDLLIRSYFAKTDEVPVILGFADVLSKFAVYVNYQRRIAYIEI